MHTSPFGLPRDGGRNGWTPTDPDPDAAEPAIEPSPIALARGVQVPFSHDPAGAFARVRELSDALCEPLGVEDFGLQSLAHASPAKWHLAHTTWFFETFVLAAVDPEFRPFHARYGEMFGGNSIAAESGVPRAERGLLSRPTVAEIQRYRAWVDELVVRGLERGRFDTGGLEVLEVGLHHEQQHQELMLVDLKHAFSRNPLRPAYQDLPEDPASESVMPALWIDHEGGVVAVGHRGHGFAFANEGPLHRVFLEPYGLASRLVTCGEFVEFMQDGGYRRSSLWSPHGWALVQRDDLRAPLYWEWQDGAWWTFTLGGMRPVDPHEPVCHVSAYEADAFARWAGARLPTELEWEAACGTLPVEGNLLPVRNGAGAGEGRLHPRTARWASSGLQQAFGDAWEWTTSAYAPYPGHTKDARRKDPHGSRFMGHEIVLRGGSCATPEGHIRPTYRKTLEPEARWQFSGLRLAR